MTPADIQDLRNCVDFTLRQHGLTHAKRCLELAAVLDNELRAQQATPIGTNNNNGNERRCDGAGAKPESDQLRPVACAHGS